MQSVFVDKQEYQLLQLLDIIVMRFGPISAEMQTTVRELIQNEPFQIILNRAVSVSNLQQLLGAA